jgi:hypothetical protein
MVAIDVEVELQSRPVTRYDDADDRIAAPVVVRRRRRRWPLLLAVLAVLMGLTLVSPSGRHQWAVSLIRQPTPYTTLSFQDAAGLPHNVESGAPVHLTFTVANHEGRLTDYPVVLSSANADGAGAATALLRTTVTIPSGGQRTMSVSVRPACKTSACELQVSLPGQAETIDVVLAMHHE